MKINVLMLAAALKKLPQPESADQVYQMKIEDRLNNLLDDYYRTSPHERPNIAIGFHCIHLIAVKYRRDNVCWFEWEIDTKML